MAEYHPKVESSTVADIDPYAGTGARPKSKNKCCNHKSDVESAKGKDRNTDRVAEFLKPCGIPISSGRRKKPNKSDPHTDGTDRIVNREWDYGMDCAANSMLFAEELIEYVLVKLGYEWPCTVGARKLPDWVVTKRFTAIVGDAIVEIIAEEIDIITTSYKELEKCECTSLEAYRRELCISAALHFKNGYDHQNFLKFAAHVSGISAFYIAKGNTQIAEGSAHILSYILNYFIYMMEFRPSNDWFNMCIEAQKIKRKIKNVN